MFTQSSPEQPLELDLLENFTAAFQDENIMSPGKSDRIHQYVSEQAKLVKPHEEVSDHGNPLEIDPCKDIPCQPGSKRPRRHEKSPKERHKRKSTKEKPQGESNVFAKRLSLMNVSKLINSSRGILAKSKKSKTVRIGKHLIQVYSSSPRKGRDQNDSKTGSLQSFPGKLYEKGSNILDTDCDDCPSQQASDDHQADPIEMSWEEDYNANSVHSAFSRGKYYIMISDKK